MPKEILKQQVTTEIYEELTPNSIVINAQSDSETASD